MALPFVLFILFLGWMTFAVIKTEEREEKEREARLLKYAEKTWQVVDNSMSDSHTIIKLPEITWADRK